MAAYVGEAGATMSQVVKPIEHLRVIVDEISRAGVQQTIGVAQVSEAVSQMDQTTQQNAALVAESAAAAESLRREIAQLVECVAQFQL
jgi:methyl-accepting chemotaxis protein